MRVRSQRRVPAARSLAALCILLCLVCAGARAGEPVPSAATEAPTTRSLPETVPPLSIAQSRELLRRAADMLDTRRTTEPALVRWVDDILRSVSLYVERVDRMHATLPDYEWATLGSLKIRSDGDAGKSWTLSTPVSRVTALAVRVRHGDIQLSRLVAADANATRWTIEQPMVVVGDQPRREVFFLPLPTRLNEVRLICRRVHAADQPRVYVEYGVCRISESAKHALHHMRQARDNLAAGQLDTALGRIRLAHDLLLEYQQSRKL